MIEYGTISELRQAHKLIISPAESDNILEFRKDKKSDALFVIPVRDIESSKMCDKIIRDFNNYMKKLFSGNRQQIEKLLYG